ncbi:DUF302 domain-containing protein [Rhizobiaceae sp. 2RAB30]
MPTGEGLVTIPSSYPAGETIDRLVAKVTALGMSVFVRIDHGAGAARSGRPLRPTQLLIFGNPKGGTALMQDSQTSGIDLPIKALAWEDDQGRTWLTCNDAAWVARRHGLGGFSAEAVQAMIAATEAAATYAAEGEPSPERSA